MASIAARADDSEGLLSDTALIEGYYRPHLGKQILFFVGCLCTGGLLALLTFWFPILRLRMTTVSSDRKYAKYVMIRLDSGLPWEYTEIDDDLPTHTRSFYFQKLRYVYSPSRHEFLPSSLKLPRIPQLHQIMINVDQKGVVKGLSSEAAREALIVHGTNNTDVPLRPLWRILMLEVFHPFYIFQLFSILLWMAAEHYYYYAGCILGMSIISIGLEAHETRKNERRLADMAHSHDADKTITVLRHGNREVIGTEHLVPGDVVIVAQGQLSCDVAIIDGRCVVDESMLTGESVPVQKPALQQEDFAAGSVEVPGRSVLFAGTHVIQIRPGKHGEVFGIVVRTGFMTARGELLRSILHPKPSKALKLHQDSMRFVGMLALLAIVGMIIAIIQLRANGEHANNIAIRSLDLLTIVIPPALPAAMTVGIVFAMVRLKKKNIFCTSPQRVNLCGGLDCLCFDKTGTLTEDQLDVYGFQSAINKTFTDINEHISTIDNYFTACGLASCHSLELVQSTPKTNSTEATVHPTSSIVGDPLDVKMFEALGNWHLSQEEAEMHILQKNSAGGLLRSLKVCRTMLFASELRRAGSVVVDTMSGDITVYVKGAPEMLKSLCLAETIPDDYDQKLETYTCQGYRVIALAYRSCPELTSLSNISSIPRPTLESNLTFLGFLVMRNCLKPATIGAISELNRAKLRIVMITGDNALTGISVSIECGLAASDVPFYLGDNNADEITWTLVPHTATDEFFETGRMNRSNSAGGRSDNSRLSVVKRTYLVSSASNAEDNRALDPITLRLETDSFIAYPQLAVTGSCFQTLADQHSPTLDHLLARGCVFARMSPAQKALLVELLQERGLTVSMCGDGANDCGALKAAHVGVSLSDTEASVAAPFTCKDPNIQCIPTMLKEGRAALTTSFAVFRYMAMYSFIQFSSVLILYHVGSNLSDFEYLYIDLFLILTLAVLMGRQPPAKQICDKPPPNRLTSIPIFTSLILQLLLNVLFQIGTLIWLHQQSWFVPLVVNPDTTNFNCMDNRVIFSVSLFQYIDVAVAFMLGGKHRAPLHKNILFVLALAVITTLSLLIVFLDYSGFANLFEFGSPVPSEGQVIIMVLIITNAVTSIALELFMVPIVQRLVQRIPCVCREQPLHDGASEERTLADSSDHDERTRLVEE